MAARGAGRGRGKSLHNIIQRSTPGDTRAGLGVDGSKAPGNSNSNSNTRTERHNYDNDNFNSMNSSQSMHSKQYTVECNANTQKQLDELFEDDKSEVAEDNYNSVLQNVTASYLANEGDDLQNGLGQTKEIFDSMMADESNICLICLDTIERKNRIWSCGACYCIMHIQCIQLWINEGSYQQKLSVLSEQHFPNKKLPWHCPKCRTEYSPSLTPSNYLCFCGKNVDPVDDPWLVPHSCGETCDRDLKPACGHKCLLLCHPGPCPPCPKSVMSSCYCGQHPKTTRRCAARVWSCGKICNKLLGCQQHRCLEKCHPGDCKSCSEVSIQSCLCGKSKEKRPCAEPQWSCDQICGKSLSCGQHYCKKTCHSRNECGECERATRIRYCPCGKSTATNLPCTEDVPCCGDTCGKALACGLHYCNEKCHYGSCSQCLEISMKSCRCGAKQKELTCSKSFTCDTRCQNIKPCGRHQCKRRCCDGISCPECDQPCGKKLNCGNHKCQSTCHSGACYPCPITINKSCSCGGTVISIPCIRQKTAKPPRCRLPCKKPSLCDHPCIQRHLCHSGECPPCNLTCGKNLKSCEHSCSSVCHDAVKVKIQHENKQAAGPWEQRFTRYIETVCRPCPPCPVPIPVMCKGGHETSDLPCSNCQVYNCHRKCGRQLSCTNHACSYECHEVTDAKDSKLAGAECEECESPCVKPRPNGCTHECLKPCHPGSCPPCKQMIKSRCHCGVTVLYIPCYEWTDKSLDKVNKLTCPGDCPKLLPCGHQCTLKCHPSGECVTECIKKVTLRCPCKRRKESFPCHSAATASVCCSDNCTVDKSNSNTDKKIDTESEDCVMGESEAAAMLPGRRQRRRKDKITTNTEVKQPLPWKQIRKYAIAVTAISAILLAFYLALISEN